MEITETHLNAIQEVAAALRMTVNDFLNEDITVHPVKAYFAS